MTRRLIFVILKNRKNKIFAVFSVFDRSGSLPRRICAITEKKKEISYITERNNLESILPQLRLQSNKSSSSCSVKRHLVRDRVSPEENTAGAQRLQREQRVMKTVYCAKGIRLCLRTYVARQSFPAIIQSQSLILSRQNAKFVQISSHVFDLKDL